jgi:hypothetical protein
MPAFSSRGHVRSCRRPTHPHIAWALRKLCHSRPGVGIPVSAEGHPSTENSKMPGENERDRKFVVQCDLRWRRNLAWARATHCRSALQCSQQPRWDVLSVPLTAGGHHRARGHTRHSELRADPVSSAEQRLRARGAYRGGARSALIRARASARDGCRTFACVELSSTAFWEPIVPRRIAFVLRAKLNQQ